MSALNTLAGPVINQRKMEILIQEDTRKEKEEGRKEREEGVADGMASSDVRALLSGRPAFTVACNCGF